MDETVRHQVEHDTPFSARAPRRYGDPGENLGTIDTLEPGTSAVPFREADWADLRQERLANEAELARSRAIIIGSVTLAVPGPEDLALAALLARMGRGARLVQVADDLASNRGPIANSVFDTSGRRIGNFLDDPSILEEIASQRVVYVTDVAEKSKLKQALRTNPFVQSSGNIPQVRYLHGYDGDVVSAASRQLIGSKRVSGDVTILNRQRIANHQVEVHVGRTHGPHVHIDRGQADEIYIRLSDPNWYEGIPRRVLENERVQDAVKRAAFYGLDF
jgi:hypothetical protein